MSEDRRNIPARRAACPCQHISNGSADRRGGQNYREPFPGMSPSDPSQITNEKSPQVAILLCTYNGQCYLADQLESFATQRYPNWSVWASDDGSTDDTRTILKTYRRKWSDGRVSLLSGPGKGHVANFLSLACREDIAADHYAFSDQDDIWEADKLERAIGWLQSVPDHVPALYCSRTRLIDENECEVGFSPLFRKPPGFANALVQNLGGGNTMVFNDAARCCIQAAGQHIDPVIHDWWVYLVVSGCGGEVYYDPHPSLRYRQHDANIVGSGRSRWVRWSNSHNRFRDWIDQNLRALASIQDWLTPDNRHVLTQFTAARQGAIFPRLLAFRRSGVYRQTFLDNLALMTAMLLRKM